ncbi:phage tail protein I [Phormidium sp. CLA17]|uniref:phage tail protein I n=1 Tax=Leptolyngbya sp. Cla-17 TaxID=2803751 RepID=UPI0014925798|nr:phage tail protein I [Leptolyngbya sp. Cla-17]MBM0744163.1 phage tail protein I [Leptolyngbya sp. Cla-17]
MNLTSKTASSYLDYLPAALHEDPFLGQFLLAFEAILSGVSVEDVVTPAGFEKTLAEIHTKFSAKTTPPEFLPWLAGWVALSLRDDWNEQVKRDFIQRIVPLYKQRGTKAAMKKLLQIYLQKQVNPQDTSVTEYVEIFEFDQIPHYFQVQLRLDSQDLTEYRRKETVARAIIDREKPAHTIYALQILMPTMRLASSEKLLAEGVKSEDISKQRLRLFANSRSRGYKIHQNKTALGTTTQRPKSTDSSPSTSK